MTLFNKKTGTFKHKHSYLRTLNEVKTKKEAEDFIRKSKKSDMSVGKHNREYKIEPTENGYKILADMR